jgi:hypothetical protein
MKTGIRSGASYRAQYTGYKASNRWQKNKIRKLEKRILANENDTGAEKALKIARTKLYGRTKPGQKGWFHPQEQKLQKEMKSEVESIRRTAKIKMDKLLDVYLDKRPSVLKSIPSVIPPTRDTVADQLFTIGIINDKRRKAVNTRMEKIRRR